MVNNWDLIQNWDLVLPPSRPSSVQLDRIINFSNHIEKSKPVAILGSTPEFRDLLYECGFQDIYVFDKNLKFYQLMSDFRVYKNPERLIEGDWCTTLNNWKEKFSLILSDLTMGNIPYPNRKKFYSLITQSLSNGGIFSDKVLTHQQATLSINGLVEKYTHLPVNLLHINQFSCEMLFCSELLELDEMVDSTKFYSYLESHIKNEKIRCFAKKSRLITPEGCVWYYGRRWDKLEHDYCPALKVISVNEDEPGSPYFGFLKIFTLIKN